MLKLSSLILLTVNCCFGQLIDPIILFPKTAGGGASTPPVIVSTNSNTGGGGSLTITITVGSDSNRGLLVVVGQGNSGGTPKTINSVDWTGNGTPQSLTQIPGFAKGDGNFCHVDAYYMVAPTAEVAGHVTITPASTPTIWWGAVCYVTNMAQTSIFGTAVTTSTTASATLSASITTGTGQLNFGATANDANGAITISGTSSPTSLIEAEGVGSDMGFGIGKSTGTGTFIWSWSAPDNGGALSTIPINGI